MKETNLTCLIMRLKYIQNACLRRALGVTYWAGRFSGHMIVVAVLMGTFLR